MSLSTVLDHTANRNFWTLGKLLLARKQVSSGEVAQYEPTRTVIVTRKLHD